MHKFIIFLILINVVSFGCSSRDLPSPPDRFGNYDPPNDDSDSPPPNSNPNEQKTRWDVPGGGGEIVRGCLGSDCIPSLQNPDLVNPDDANYLREDDLVFGLVRDNAIIAYPHKILDWHEIINQKIGTSSIAITYCPLTGSGVGIDLYSTSDLFTIFTEVDELLSFGVSGLLYNNNLVLYDRGSGSNWSQMLLQCVNGVLRGTPMVTVSLIETSWRTWKQMFPNAKVVSDNTGFDRPYDVFPYGNYKTNPFLLFGIMIDDTRLNRKERLHGIIIDRWNFKAKTYRFSLFENEARAINDEVHGKAVVVAGMKSADFYISYSRIMSGAVLTFDVKTDSPQIYPFDLIDNEGNVWNLLGEAISGPRIGQKLTPTISYNAYWFAWGTFFPDVPIYGE